MPSITLNLKTSQAARIVAALSSANYPSTLTGYKALLVDYTRLLVQEYEQAQAQKKSPSTVTAPAALEIT